MVNIKIRHVKEEISAPTFKIRLGNKRNKTWKGKFESNRNSLQLSESEIRTGT